MCRIVADESVGTLVHGVPERGYGALSLRKAWRQKDEKGQTDGLDSHIRMLGP
jgi:hypothetical protein